jgi:hypothetical protein
VGLPSSAGGTRHTAFVASARRVGAAEFESVARNNVVDPLSGRITSRNGEQHVQPKVMDVLVLLAIWPS